MNITLLHYSSPPIVGGVESVMAHQARLFADHGHQVSILAGRGEQFDPRVQFHLLPQVDSRHPDIIRLKRDLDRGIIPVDFKAQVEFLYTALERLLQDVQFLIAHNVCSLHKNLALTAALKLFHGTSSGSTLILWHHDLAWTTTRYRDELHIGYPWDLLRENWPGVVHVTVSEQRQKELADLLSIPAESIRVIPNGINPSEFLKLESTTINIVRRLDLELGFPIILMPIRLTPRKNIELAINILSDLRRKFPQARLLVTGPIGPHNPTNQQYLEKLLGLRDALSLRDSAHFLAEFTSDFLPDAVIADFYRLADILLLTSFEEGFGIPILEAGLSHLPIFCSDIPSLRALGSQYLNYFDPAGSSREIAERIAQHLINDPSYGFKTRVKTDFTWEKIYQEKIVPLISG